MLTSIDLQGFLLALSTLTASVSIGYTVITAVRSRRARLTKLRAAEEQQFAQVLESDDLTELGAYLDNVLGDFAVSEYADDRAVRHRVDSYLRRIQDFVGTVEDFRASAAPAEDHVAKAAAPAGPTGAPTEPGAEDPAMLAENPLLGDAYHELREGEVWNALAKMRRAVEQRLREIALAAGAPIPKGGSGTLLVHLANHGMVSPDVFAKFHYALAIANRAIHGKHIDITDAEIAIRRANEAFSLLPNPNAATLEPGAKD
jgi:hypothetical protein